ncbi:MAG: glycosyltransferase [Phycisphaerales bacterium]|nr:glycosyltransferase [Phycisphaerales bacterium]
MHTTICIITCGRPDGLARLFDSLVALEIPAGVDHEVLVVDNHPDQLGRDVCGSYSDRLPIRYEVEPRRGIPPARNAAIEKSSPETDFIAFVDDDETVDPGWLASLLAVQEQTGADVVTGPAVPRLAEDTPAWLVASGAFDLERYETGSDRPFAFTHNVLTRRTVFEQVQPNFDDRLIATGGSDTHFYLRARRAGFRITWADEAIAREWVPAERTSSRWLLKRALRIGGTDAFLHRDLEGTGSAWMALPWRAARYVARGVVRGLAFPARGRAAFIRCGQDLAHATGLVAGLFGYRYGEYRVKK